MEIFSNVPVSIRRNKLIGFCSTCLSAKCYRKWWAKTKAVIVENRDLYELMYEEEVDVDIEEFCKLVI